MDPKMGPKTKRMDPKISGWSRRGGGGASLGAEVGLELVLKDQGVVVEGVV